MKHCAYIYRDPRDGTPVYVGKGTYTSERRNRALSHLCSKLTTKLPNFLRARAAEGFDVLPQIILCNTDEEAIEMETLLIAMIGRLDLGTGSLFNLTDGGDGTVGKVCTDEQRRVKSEAQRRRYSSVEARDITSKAQKARYARGSKTAAKACTVDGVNWYPSFKALVASLGHGYNGRRSPNLMFAPKPAK